jgi:hypothetical protein
MLITPSRGEAALAAEHDGTRENKGIVKAIRNVRVVWKNFRFIYQSSNG